ncbi:heptaprenyl diphosphate synthase component 1 [Brevibacillus ginsengisoli]|uniref:heptaprenyl diphosphate synthase component 1 n=1 Tax=Brevibacillus ginsengisoli TaxID=363854 RepID=UPI003CF53B87
MSNYAGVISDDLVAIKQKIMKLISQSYVEQYVDIPAMAENRLVLLYVFLCENGLDREQAKVLCTTTGLVQLGLDTHELVKTGYDSSIVAERNRQLTVLAGDFYSSLYYHLLAEHGEIEAVKILAQSIQEVNEAKMNLYLKEQEVAASWDKYFALRKTIDTALYLGFVKHYAQTKKDLQFWTALIEETSVVEQMIDEWEQLKWQKQDPIGFSRFMMQKPDSTQGTVLEFVEAKVQELMGICEQLIRGFYPSDKLSALTWVTSRYSHRVNRLKRVVEEM